MTQGFVARALACMCVAAIAGCQMGSSSDRINAAMPVGAEILAAQDTLFADVREQKGNVDALQSALDERMDKRATECARGVMPGMFDDDEAIRAKLTDKDCFAKADVELREWLQLQRVSLVLAQPPLRPLPKQMATLSMNNRGAAVFASDAGVAAVTGTKDFTAWSLVDGSVIAEREDEARSIGALSSNGRVYATFDDQSLQLRRVDTGDVIATLPRMQGDSFRFVGSTGAIGRVAREGRSQDMTYFDFRGGRQVPLGVDPYSTVNVLPLPNDDKRFLLTGGSAVMEMELRTDENGTTPTIVRKAADRSFRGGANASLTADGRTLLAASSDHIDLLDVATFQTRSITLAPMNAMTIVPTADPDRIVFRGYYAGAGETGMYVYSLSKRTLARVDATRAWGRIAWLPSMRSNIMADGARVEPLASIATAAPEDANLVIEREGAAAAAQAEVRRLQYEAARSSVPPVAPSSASVDLARRAEVERVIRDNHLDAQRAASMRQWLADAERKDATPARATPQTQGAIAIPADADVRAVGVYEAKDGNTGAHRAGTVNVIVMRSDRPIVLVLASYESVNWNLQLQPGAKVSHVLLSGYYSSQVFNAGKARIDSIGTGYAYDRGSSEFARLDARVQQATGKRIGSFQGAYSGTTFSLGR